MNKNLSWQYVKILKSYIVSIIKLMHFTWFILHRDINLETFHTTTERT